MMGKLSMEESRKEIRNSPGAPSVPAKATIFAFHVFRGNSTIFPHAVQRSWISEYKERRTPIALQSQDHITTTSRSLLRSHRRLDPTPSARSRKAEARKRHFPEAAAARRAPETIRTTSAARKKDNPDRPRAIPTLPWCRFAAYRQLDAACATARGVRRECARWYGCGRTPAPRRRCANSHWLPRKPARSPCTNARDKTCANDFRCETPIPHDRCTASHPWS